MPDKKEEIIQIVNYRIRQSVTDHDYPHYLWALYRVRKLSEEEIEATMKRRQYKTQRPTYRMERRIAVISEEGLFVRFRNDWAPIEDGPTINSILYSAYCQYYESHHYIFYPPFARLFELRQSLSRNIDRYGELNREKRTIQEKYQDLFIAGLKSKRLYSASMNGTANQEKVMAIKSPLQERYYNEINPLDSEFDIINSEIERCKAELATFTKEE
jgi:hypothetical protein